MFGNRPAPTPQTPNYVATVEAILQQLGLDPAASRLNTAEGRGWSFRRGSAIIEIYLTQQAEAGFIQVLSPILHLPQTNVLPLYRRLLERNLQLTSVAFGVYNDVVYLFYERPLDGLDATEADAIINTISQYADQFDNELMDEFGGRLYGQA